MAYYCCGTCKFNKYNRDVKNFTCNNEDSDNYGASTLYNDKCEEWEEKDV